MGIASLISKINPDCSCPMLIKEKDVAEAPSLNAFKERLDSCWATIFPDLALSSVTLFITVHGFGTQVLVSRPVNSDSKT